MKGSIWLAVHFQKYWETAGGILNIISPQPLPAESWVHNLPKVHDPPQMIVRLCQHYYKSRFDLDQEHFK